MINYLEKQGVNLIDLGYPIVPIKSGSKRPSLKKWQKIEASEDDLKYWLSNKCTNIAGNQTGVGVLTKHFPAVDIDILDPDAAEDVMNWVKDRTGADLVRLGKFPKVLLPFRLAPDAAPMKKRKSHVFTDGKNSHAVEVLGDGQQYVVYHEHPDTKKPYEWLGDKGLADVKAEDLPILTPDDVDALMAFVDLIATEYFWDIEKQASAKARVYESELDELDALANIKPRLDWDAEQVREKIMQIPVEEHYDDWLQVGMAINHEMPNDEGLAIWHEWSEQSSQYDPDEIDKKWSSFSIDGNGQTTTMRSVIQWANEAEFDSKEQALEALLAEVAKADTRRALTVELPKKIAKSSIDSLMLEELVGAVKNKLKSVTGQAISVGEVRKLCRPELINVKESIEADGFPWCDDYVFLSKENKLFNTDTKVELSIDGFNNLNDRRLVSADMIDEGQYVPLFRASHVALNVVQIPTCDSTMYAPRQQAVFELPSHPHQQFANTYRPSNVKLKTREHWDDQDRDCIARVEDVLNIVADNDRDRALFRQWVTAAVLSHGTKDLKWSIVAQGAQGSGKTFWHAVVSSILGWHNTRTIAGTAIGRQFSDWAQGHVFGTIEEVKLHGGNRWDIMNGMKTFITNEVVSVELKGKGVKDLWNVATYFLTTQFRDAMPFEESDRRYYMIFSTLQSKSDINEFRAERDLSWWRDSHDMVNVCGDALLGWLSETDMTGFDYSQAPESRAKQQLIEMSRSDDEQFIIDMINDAEQPFITDELLRANALRDAAELNGDGLDLDMRTRTVTRILSALGFVKVERIRVGGKLESFWSRKRKANDLSSKEVRLIFDAQKQAHLTAELPDDFL